eukprot:UN23038
MNLPLRKGKNSAALTERSRSEDAESTHEFLKKKKQSLLNLKTQLDNSSDNGERGMRRQVNSFNQTSRIVNQNTVWLKKFTKQQGLILQKMKDLEEKTTKYFQNINKRVILLEKMVLDKDNCSSSKSQTSNTEGNEKKKREG